MNETISLRKFADIDLNDPFFDSLKEDYPGFEEWFDRKAKDERKAYVQYTDNKLQAFLFLKDESEEEVTDVTPNRADEVYVTVFAKHGGLIRMLERYGFNMEGTKGEENVYVKNMKSLSGDQIKDYPLLTTKGKRKFVLSIYPEYHTRMFPDSILKNEENQKYELIKDVSYTNSIHQIDLCSMTGVSQLQKGDLIAIYRTKDDKGPARYRSVVTSVCQVEEIKSPKDFQCVEDFVNYTNYYSIFDTKELRDWYNKKNCVVLKMTYNVAFKKRVTMDYLLNELKISPEYWGFFQLTDEQFSAILKKGEIDENIIID